MLFTRPEYFLFLAAVLVLAATLRSPTARKAMLLLGSYYFYAHWDWRFTGLLALSTLVDFAVGLAFERAPRERTRRALLVASLTFNLGILALFKYYDFFVGNLRHLIAPLGLDLTFLGLILPVGISFYTFQTLSYSIDRYRGEIPACRSLLDFALFVSFFPQLIAGPIVRASDLLPQLRALPRPSRDDLAAGGARVVTGIFKKVFVADHLASYVDFVFGRAGAFDGATTWLAVLAFAAQIYCDFSGYSDVAIGTARMLGLRFAENFDFPYLATGMSDFWRRWHISLSTWLRDYLYIPLGGNRHGTRRAYRNLLVTMLLGGLWHGAAWTFVVWGGLHGLALVAERTVRRLVAGHRFAVRLPAAAAHGASRLATFAVVLVGWVFFRAPDLSSAIVLLRRMLFAGGGISWLHPFVLVLLVGVAGVHLVALGGRSDLLATTGTRRGPALLLAMAGLTLAIPPGSLEPFLYFQF